MKCKSIESWTFSLLVGAYVDLAIAYFLLCGSTIAYFASIFLGLFGLSLPCPCNGHFGNPNSKRCLQQLLVNDPCQKTSSVQYLVKKKFPFDSMLAGETKCQLDMKFVNERNFDTEGVEHEGEGSCSPCTKIAGAGKRNDCGIGLVSFPAVEEGRTGLGGNGANYTHRYGLRRRSKSGSLLLGASSISSYDLVWSDACSVPQSPSAISEVEKVAESDRLAADSPDAGVVSSDFGSPDIIYNRFELSGPVEQKSGNEKDQLQHGEVSFSGQLDLGFSSDENDTIKKLKQALEEEHSACRALYVELEKERSAAASAADEAMAMMLRLQEEKASTEMEARQYKRITEEKSAYDAEEMSILKEILVRREKENHFLEKEVEAYRKMMLGNEMLDLPIHKEERTFLIRSTEDHMRMVQLVNGMKKDVTTYDSFDYKLPPSELRDSILTFGKELSLPDLDADNDTPIQEGIGVQPHLMKNDDSKSQGLSIEKETYDQQKGLQRMECSELSPSSRSKESNLLNKNIIPVNGELNDSYDNRFRQILSNQGIEISENCDDHPCSIDAAVESRKTSKGQCVQDFHAIDTESHKHGKIVVNEDGKLSSTSRSCSDLTTALPSSLGKALLSDIRRNSMSAVDYERLKIDTEVEMLRERLRIVQEGREKLSFSGGCRDMGKSRLQFQEDRDGPSQYIKEFTEIAKSAHQGPLSPYSSKVLAKRSSWRSMSLVNRST